jgi:hypothetical protein
MQNISKTGIVGYWGNDAGGFCRLIENNASKSLPAQCKYH